MTLIGHLPTNCVVKTRGKNYTFSGKENGNSTFQSKRLTVPCWYKNTRCNSLFEIKSLEGGQCQTFESEKSELAIWNQQIYQYMAYIQCVRACVYTHTIIYIHAECISESGDFKNVMNSKCFLIHLVLTHMNTMYVVYIKEFRFFQFQLSPFNNLTHGKQKSAPVLPNQKKQCCEIA
jgi:hypothetical protein